MNSKPLPAKIKRWHEYLREIGCAAHPGTPAHIHHIFGARAKRKGVDWWGELLVIPLCPQCHRNLHANRAACRESERRHWFRLADGNVPQSVIDEVRKKWR